MMSLSRAHRRVAAAVAAVMTVTGGCGGGSGDDARPVESAAPATVGPSASPNAPSNVSSTTRSSTAETNAPAPLPDTPGATVASTSAPATPASTSPLATPPDVGSGRYPSQPAGVVWPTSEWPIADPPAGIDTGLVDVVADAAFGAPDAAARLRSILVVHGGAIVYERYHPLDGPDTVFESYSVAKSVTAALTGMLVDDGVLDPDAPAPVPEWQGAGDARAAITLDDLLRMSSGLEWRESFAPDDVVWQMLQAEHAADVPIAQPLVHEPGTIWNYSTGTSAIIADVLADALGGPDALDRFIHERLMAPLGIRSTEIGTDGTGTYYGGLGFDSTARDFARFGLLHLRGGLWDGRRLLSEPWIDRVRLPSDSNERYGAHWWLLGPDDTFSAQGLFGQQIVVDVAHDLVVVATATAGGDSRTVVSEVLRQFDALSP
jgi:CubicO group peptidase (beta-lactamase class C family)